MRFEPVFLPAGLERRVRQTVLRHFAACPRSGYLELLHAGETATTAEMVRGTAVHLVHERAVRLMLEQGEATAPPELVKTLADEVLAELPVPFSEHDVVREQAWRLGSELAVDPGAVVAAETLFSLDLEIPCPHCQGTGADCVHCDDTGRTEFEVRCRIDYAEVLDHGARVHVQDLKSSRAAVAQDEIARKRPDGSLSARSFQLVLYAIALAYGHPVHEGPCGWCEGTGSDGPVECLWCWGRGVDAREPYPVAGRAQVFELEYVYPGIEGSDGKMLRRRVTLTRSELEQYRVSLAGLVSRLAAAELSGDWPAVVSDQACAECAAPAECPIPKELRDHRGTITSEHEAAEAFEVHARDQKETAARSRELRAYVEEHGPVRFGGEMVAEIVATSSTEIRDKDAFMDAVERTAAYGEPLERWRYVKEKHGARLKLRPLTPAEIDAEGSNHE